jgi:hypothetical protein
MHFTPAALLEELPESGDAGEAVTVEMGSAHGNSGGISPRATRDKPIAFGNGTVAIGGAGALPGVVPISAIGAGASSAAANASAGAGAVVAVVPVPVDEQPRGVTIHFPPRSS